MLAARDHADREAEWIYMKGRLGFLAKLYTAPIFLAALVAGSLAYYLLLNWIIYSESTAILITVPTYIVYLLVFTSANLLAISAYRVMSVLSTRMLATADSLASAATTVVGSVVIGCACQAPILAELLYALGMGSIYVSSVIVSVNSLQTPIMLSLVALNLLLFYHSFSALYSKSESKRRRKSR